MDSCGICPVEQSRFHLVKRVEIYTGILPINRLARSPRLGGTGSTTNRDEPKNWLKIVFFGVNSLRNTAEDKFFGKRGYRVLELPTGQGLVIK